MPGDYIHITIYYIITGEQIFNMFQSSTLSHGTVALMEVPGDAR